jgi:large subunit ribosomal protein L4
MATVSVRDVTGEVLEERELPEELFGVAVNVPVMHQVVVAGASARRAGSASTKTRGEVSGGGVKPWRQKGTGRARQGSIRAPHFMGGGVSHGPKPRGYEMRVNKKMRKLALRSALSDALASGKLAAIDALEFEAPRTRDALGVLEKLDLGGRVLLVLARPDELVEKSFRNLGWVKIDYPGNLSTYDVLFADRVVFTSEALDVLTGEAHERPARPVKKLGVPKDEAEPDATEPEGAEPETVAEEEAVDAEAEALDQEDEDEGGQES